MSHFPEYELLISSVYRSALHTYNITGNKCDSALECFTKANNTNTDAAEILILTEKLNKAREDYYKACDTLEIVREEQINCIKQKYATKIGQDVDSPIFSKFWNALMIGDGELIDQITKQYFEYSYPGGLVAWLEEGRYLK